MPCSFNHWINFPQSDNPLNEKLLFKYLWEDTLALLYDQDYKYVPPYRVEFLDQTFLVSF